ncbi:hypothetical protein POSPLADRAFT_1144222 [Postia placenta MAD-698-R-SB12]|uniref:DUF6533 domain-containing protein n=1 Tax=Postia placenta MAD-698-R-SB12 TaxID=670580 RepID=A0A1X6MZ01_9APHY|nr:hypothetical protein POSPLADRAFT_1144222 [Postia placenta MAD-698-R-SB12]OSX61480.1 hypothetical protein POSPLADRAFT_1144222 [Postia placenta MAD-698-R-SB12]
MSESCREEARFLRIYQNGIIEEYITTMAMSLFVYDSIISFNLEWRAVWSRKISGATALYLALRHVTLLNLIADIIALTVTSYLISELAAVGSTCGIYLAQAVQRSHATRLTAFASIRVYAIDGRRWTKAAIVMMLGLVPVAINIYGASKTIMYCAAEVSGDEFSVSISKANISCVLVSNLLVVVATWQATRAGRGVTAWSSRGSLTAVLFRDGTVHFALVVGLNAANIVVALLLEESIDLSIPVELISTVVLCRFFLNLRQFSNPNTNNSSESSHASSFASFASRIIGNLGEMLEDEPQAPDDDFEGELDGMNDAGEANEAIDFDDRAKAPSNADKAQTRMVTTAVFEQKTDERGAADHQFSEVPDDCLEQRVMDIV